VTEVSDEHLMYYRPKIEQPSNIINDDDFEVIWSFLPDRFHICDPKLLFYSENDGCSFKTLFRLAEKQHPTILLIKTTKDKIFGAFLVDDWVKNEFFGTNESFVFTLKPQEKKFPWKEGLTPAFAFINEQRFTIGGSAIWLDEDLRLGRSTRSMSYENDPLNGDDEEFECKSVELWTIK